MSNEEGVLIEPRAEGDDTPLENRSFLFIEMVQLDSARMKHLQVHNMTPMQLLAVAEYVSLEAKNALLKERQDNEIAVARQQADQLDLGNLR